MRLCDEETQKLSIVADVDVTDALGIYAKEGEEKILCMTPSVCAHHICTRAYKNKHACAQKLAYAHKHRHAEKERKERERGRREGEGKGRMRRRTHTRTYARMHQYFASASDSCLGLRTLLEHLIAAES